MLVNLKGRYFEVNLEVTSSLLKQIWETPESVGGGAKSFKVAGGTCWRTKSGWGFVRSGSRSFGKVEFTDPMPGRGEHRRCSKVGYQFEGQTLHPYGVTVFVD